MGTRSFVGVMLGDVCRTVYVHWDGYLDGVGARLQDYTYQAVVQELISHGDRSSLTEGYYKDHGLINTGPTDYLCFDMFFESAENSGAEWYYIFKDGVWYCGCTYSKNPLYRKLTAYNEACEIYERYCAEVDAVAD